MFVNTIYLPLVKTLKLEIPSRILALISGEKGLEFNFFKWLLVFSKCSGVFIDIFNLVSSECLNPKLDPALAKIFY